VVFAADLWNLVLDSTAKCDDLPMGPGTLPFFFAQLVWGSVFIEYSSHFSLIPLRLTNAISAAYERHLRKPQNASFLNQYLQERGGETTASLSSAIVVFTGVFTNFLLRKHFITEKNLKKKSGDVNDEANFSFYFLLHNLHKPLPLRL